MKIITSILTLAFIFISLISDFSFAQEIREKYDFPNVLTFDGFVTDAASKELPDGKYNLSFSIYDSPNAQTPIWSEEHKNVIVNRGNFHVQLGNGDNPKPLNIPFDKKYYLGIKIGSEQEMPKRLELVSSPYSLGAKYANSVSDASITNEKLKANSITDDKIESINVNKIINLPESIGSINDLSRYFQLYGSDYEWWTTSGNLIWGPERHFIGTRNERNFIIQSHEIQRMFFDPYGYVLLGTVQDSVNFEVIGKSTFSGDGWIKGKLGVGVDPATAKMHINSDFPNLFRVDYQSNNLFEIDTTGRVVIRSSVSGPDNDTDNYPLYIDGKAQGIAIRINGNDWLFDGNANNNNNYMSFWVNNNLLAPVFGDMAGRIEGQTWDDYSLDFVNVTHNVYIAALVVAEIIALASTALEAADIISIAADLAENISLEALDFAQIGVTYESGSGDYAEWLLRKDEKEEIIAGDIVGLYNGKITKQTSSADQYMIVSTTPIVLGNMVSEDKEHLYEKVAFMGQVPVKVRGVVNEDDYIIPSGLNDGTGIAISQELITADEYYKIVGRAWSSSQNESVKMINVIVGFDSRDLGHCINKYRQQDQHFISAKIKIEQDINLISKKVDKYITEYQELENIINDVISKAPKNNININSVSRGYLK